jgi:preprotein translocase subunit SecA
MLDAKNARLLEIATGEGKSTIISAVAVIKALQGHQVDVITSSSILAKRDV